MRILILLSLAAFALAAEAPALPRDAQAVLDQLDRDVAKLHEKAAGDLAKVQDKETRAGHLEAAMAIKAKVAALTPAKADAPKKVPAVEGSRDLADGTYDFSMVNGHAGKVIVKGKSAVYGGFTGTISKVGNDWSIAWVNNTTWVIKAGADNTLSLVASDGNGTLVLIAP